MLETHLESLITRQRLRMGPAANHIDAFADSLYSWGYRPMSIIRMLRCLAGWTDWLLANGFSEQELLRGLQAYELALKKEQRAPYARGPSHRSLKAASIFIEFLRKKEAIDVPESPSSARIQWTILEDFRCWMRKHRGVTETTLGVYQGILVGLLDKVGGDPRSYTAEALRGYVLEKARPKGIGGAKNIVVAVRSFCRFLGVTGLIAATGLRISEALNLRICDI